MKVKVVGQCWESSQNGLIYDTDGLSPTLVSGCHSGVEPKIIIEGNYLPSNHNASRIVNIEGLSPAVMENHGTVTAIKIPQATKHRIRKLTPRECFRLMGVSETNIDKMQDAGISNSQQYKLAGNSIVVDVLYHIFRKMFIDTKNEDNQLTLF